MNYSVELNELPSATQAYQLNLLDELNQPVGYAVGELRQHPVWYNSQLYFFLTTMVITHQDQPYEFNSQLLKAVETFARGKGAYWIRGQWTVTASSDTKTAAEERNGNSFWAKNGYGLKREIYDGSIRFWKPLTEY